MREGKMRTTKRYQRKQRFLRYPKRCENIGGKGVFAKDRKQVDGDCTGKSLEKFKSRMTPEKVFGSGILGGKGFGEAWDREGPDSGKAKKHAETLREKGWNKVAAEHNRWRHVAVHNTSSKGKVGTIILKPLNRRLFLANAGCQATKTAWCRATAAAE